MAFNQRPTSPTEVVSMAQRGGYREDKITQIVTLYQYLDENYDTPNPLLLMGSGGKNEVKVLPSVLTSDSRLNQNDKRIAGQQLARRAEVSLKISFGVGSVGSGNRIRYNMGNAAEGILAGAIAARFINKEKRITTRNVVDTLDALQSHIGQSGNIAVVNHTFKSENFKTSKERKIVEDDDVRVDISLSSTNMALVFPDHYMSNDREERAQAHSDRNEIIAACMQYANSREISQLANVMYYNRVKDDIHINADGVGGENSTKVDIYLTINGQKHIDIPAKYSGPRGGGEVRQQRLNITQISLKREVNQFAQVGGWDIDTMQRFWGLILDENIETNSQLLRYYEIQNSRDHSSTLHHAAAVMRNVYIWANTRLQTKFNNPSWREHFVNTIHNFATYNEENVQLVEIIGSGYEKYDMRKLLPALNGDATAGVPANLTLSSKLRMTSAQRAGNLPLPVVVVSLTNNNNGDVHEILQFRHKIEWSGTAIRNYVEKRPGLYNYAQG